MLNELQIKNGISMLYDMELNNYLTTRAIRRLNYEINKLGYAKQMKEPKFDESSKFYEHTRRMAVAGVLAGSTIGMFAGFMPDRYDLFFAFKRIFGITIIGTVIGIIIGLIIDGIIHASKVNQKRQKYNEEMAYYQKAKSNDIVRVNKENIQRTALINQREILQKRLQTAQNQLRKYYNMMQIDINYRNLVPIGYMDEFIRLGIATKLTGADGLYYLVRKELRMDQMQASLDDISSKLDQIIDNQHALYSELLSINNKCENMIQATLKASADMNRRLDTINSNTSITAYNSERILKEQEFQNYFLLLQSVH